MRLNDVLKIRNMTKYKLSKVSGVPYSTVSDICNGVTEISKCSAETVFKLAAALDLSMESLLEPSLLPRCDFELYKSNVCHRLKNLGDADFVVDVLEKDDIRTLFERQWYPESLYLLATLDYICRINKYPLCTRYNDIRTCKLERPIFPSGVVVTTAVLKDDDVRSKAIKEAIPEFMKFNIVECEVRDVI